MRALAKLYLDAAEHLDGLPSGAANGACDAVFEVAPVQDTAPARWACELMSEVYEPEAMRAGGRRMYWGANFGARTLDTWDVDVDEAKQCHVLMLLFTSAMAEAGDI